MTETERYYAGHTREIRLGVTELIWVEIVAANNSTVVAVARPSMSDKIVDALNEKAAGEQDDP